MFISCKCMNIIATLPPQVQRSSSVHGDSGGSITGVVNFVDSSSRNNNNNNNYNNSDNATEDKLTVVERLAALMLYSFEQQVKRDFSLHSNFMDFFKRDDHRIIPDLTVNEINLDSLILGKTLNLPDESWQLIYCLHCGNVVFAKRLSVTADAAPPIYLISERLLCSNEELTHRRSDKSYSEAFCVKIYDNDDKAGAAVASPPITLSSSACQQQRVRQLQSQYQARVQEEINETTACIERLVEQKYALLKSFREKSDQEFALISRRIQQLSDQEYQLLDHGMPVALEVTGYSAGVGGARRRNTITSRRDMGVPTTPTTTMVQPPNFLALSQQPPVPAAATTGAGPALPRWSSVLTTRKMSNFDTPPATPEATPMSVGNSPTFKQQQQQLQLQQQQQQQGTAAVGSNILQLSTPGAVASASPDDADDCLFDLEDVDGLPQTQAQPSHIYQQQQQQHQQQYQRLQQQHDNMSEADEAEDALDLDSSLPIPMSGAAGSHTASAQMAFANFARSLPVEIANSPLAVRANLHNNNNNNAVLEDEEVLDNTVDIAASIKALAKSVHGEAVFGDLPRPRLRSQI